MNLIPWNIVRKDFRLTRLYLVAWWAILALGAIMTIWNLNHILQDPKGFAYVAHRDFVLDYGKYLTDEFPYLINWPVLMLDAVLLAVIVDLIFKADSPIDELAVWRTRPITGLGVLRAKLMFLALFCFLVPGAIQTGECIWLCGDWAGCLHGLARFALLQFAFVAVIASAAVLFRRTFSGLLVFSIIAFGILLLGQTDIGIFFVANQKASYAFQDGLPNAWAALVILGLTGLGVAALMYAGRSRAVGKWACGSGALAALLTSFIGSNYSEVSVVGAPQLDDRVQISFDPTADYGMSGVEGHPGLTRFELYPKIILRGAPDSVLHVSEINSHLSWPDAKPAPVNVPRPENDNPMFPTCGLINFPSAVEAAGYGRLLGEDYPYALADVFQLSKEQMAQAAAKPAHWQGTLTGKVGKLVVDWDIPFADGVKWTYNQFFYKVEQRASGENEMSFLLWETSPISLPWFSPPPEKDNSRITLLYNPTKKQSIFIGGGWAPSYDESDNLSIYFINLYPFSVDLTEILGNDYPVKLKGDALRMYHEGLANHDTAMGKAAILTWQRDRMAFLRLHRQEMADWLVGAHLVDLRFVPDRQVYNTATIDSVQIITPDLLRIDGIPGP